MRLSGQEGEENCAMGAGSAGSSVRAVLASNPDAHFHAESICLDPDCLHPDHPGSASVYYPTWVDIWQQERKGFLLRDHVFRVFCKTHPGLNLAVHNDKLVLMPANTQDESQQWVKDESYGLRAKDCYGHPAFSLINKKTGKILKHGKHKGHQVHLMDYEANVRDDDIMWTESQDFGEGFKTLRCASNTLLNLTVSGQGKSLELDTWHKTDHQLWKVFPL
ncbi:hypothetical protein KP509_23G076400 [Ceratopteris richardii]|uniref:Uncharacterized protein n=1 Tax=Ceratopteris richardii TaxID=49495 RepID=A0A8T2S3D0_CERRI|nr:hypothetical protein KP509_23G076400 [Ceratopteris richardii]